MASRRTKITLTVAAALVAILAAVVLGAHALISSQDHELIKRQIASFTLKIFESLSIVTLVFIVDTKF